MIAGGLATAAILERAKSCQKRKEKESDLGAKEKGRNKLLRRRSKELREPIFASEDPVEPAKTEKNIRIATQNIRVAVCTKASRIKKYMNDKRIDVMVLTETKMPTNREDQKKALQELFENEGEILINGIGEKEAAEKTHTRKIKKINKNRDLSEAEKKEQIEMLDPRAQAQAQGGVLMIIGKRLAKYMGKKGVREKDQRTVTAEFNFPRGRVRIHAMYAPANGGSERERHWEMWKDKINDGDDTTERIIIGDMNAYPRVCDARRKS